MPPHLSRQNWKRTLLLAALSIAPLSSAQAANFSAQLSAAPASFQGVCPATIRFTGEIRAVKPGKVQFKYVRSDGASSPVQTLLFSTPGGKPISTTWTLGGQTQPRYQGWIAIQFVHPQVDRSAPTSFSVQCAGKLR